MDAVSCYTALNSDSCHLLHNIKTETAAITSYVSCYAVSVFDIISNLASVMQCLF